MRRLIIWGAGELGGRVAAGWVAAHGTNAAIGLTRTAQRHAALRAAGIDPRLGGAAALLQPADCLLLALPGHANQREAIAALAGTAPPARVVLISSTGYYGAPSGPVDEQTPPGTSDRARAMADTERRFREWAGARGVVLRMGGLYRRGRGPMSAFVRKQTPSTRPPDTTLALIHYADAATAALRALEREETEPVYVVVTPPCPTRRAFYTAACTTLGWEPPQFAPPDNRPPAQYDVSLLRRDLLPQPRYPDWHAALLL